MNRPDLRLSLTAAALLTALAACGGSSDSTDSNTATKSLPGTENASTLTPKDVQPAASESVSMFMLVLFCRRSHSRIKNARPLLLPGL